MTSTHLSKNFTMSNEFLSTDQVTGFQYSAHDTQAERLRRAREHRHMKQNFAAQKIGISKDALSRIECGKYGASQETLRAAAELYKIPLRLLWVPVVDVHKMPMLTIDEVLANDILLKRFLYYDAPERIMRWAAESLSVIRDGLRDRTPGYASDRSPAPDARPTDSPGAEYQ